MIKKFDLDGAYPVFALKLLAPGNAYILQDPLKNQVLFEVSIFAFDVSNI
jgi:hypothetical protein